MPSSGFSVGSSNSRRDFFWFGFERLCTWCLCLMNKCRCYNDGQTHDEQNHGKSGKPLRKA